MRNFKILFALGLLSSSLFAAAPAANKLAPEAWAKSIEATMPTSTTVKTKKRNVLMFSLATGYKHSVIPFVDEMMKVLCDRTQAFNLTISRDIDVFEVAQIYDYDAIIINNTCSDRKECNLFRDVLIHQAETLGANYKNLSDVERAEKAAKLEKNLLDYVHSGKGLMILHGAINILNKSEEISAMMGGSFDYHPKFQEITLNLVEPSHPLLKAFEGKEVVYSDEPYILNGAYDKFNFRPLLKMDTSKLVNVKDEVHSMPRYMAWVKSYGTGRVLFSSPGHDCSTYENPKFIQFYLDGLQYVLGDLKCDDSVPAKVSAK